MNFVKPVVIITGGSQGLGFALAQTLLQASFAVAICARDSTRLVDALQQLNSPDSVFAASGDVTDPTFRSHFIQSVAGRFGRIDALVNNASTLGHTPLPTLLETSASNLRIVFETNFVAPILWVQEALPWLQKAGRGLVVGISSDAAVGGYEGWGVYGSAKAALDLAHVTLGAELPANITALSVDPGDMDTAMHHAAIPDDTGMAHPAEVAKAMCPLFLHLHSHGAIPAPSGARLQVHNGQLVGGGQS
jgi:NAD(P)-dependent dehydrogenase (short-subunit alcohol dehydrogenase family)